MTRTPSIDATILTVFFSDVESLRKGVIKTSKNKTKAPYTILVIGETGVGKSSVLELLANVLAGNDADCYNFEILDHMNEQGGPANQSQTNSTHIYEFTSKNGVVVSTRICEHRECSSPCTSQGSCSRHAWAGSYAQSSPGRAP